MVKLGRAMSHQPVWIARLQALRSSRSLAARALAFVRQKMALADTDRLGRDLGQLVVGNEFDRILQRELDRWRQCDCLVLARSANIGKLLALDRIDDEIVVPAMDADDHALVELVAG